MNRFDISEFTSKFLEVGLLTKSNFYIKFNPPASLDPDLKDVAMLCGATQLPGKRLMTTELKPYGYGQTIKSPYDVLYDDIELTFFVDASRAMAVQLFNDWLRLTISESREFPKNAMRVGYRKDYTCDLTIYVVSQLAGSGEVEDSDDVSQDGGMAVIECTLVDAFPIQVGSIELDWGVADEFIRLPVTFAFRTAEYRYGKFSPIGGEQRTSYKPIAPFKNITKTPQALETGFSFNTLTGTLVRGLQQASIFKTQWDNLLNSSGAQQTTQALMPFIGNNRTATDTINNLGTIITNTQFVRRNASSILKFP